MFVKSLNARLEEIKFVLIFIWGKALTPTLAARAVPDFADKRPYYVRWLQRFLAGPGGDPRYTPQDAQRVFLEGLEHAGQTPEWQVSQAARAVDLFQRHYMPFREGQDGATADNSRVQEKPPTMESANRLR